MRRLRNLFVDWEYVCHVNYCITQIESCQAFLCYNIMFMKWLIIAVIIVAQQPAKAPESKGAAETNHAQRTSLTKKSEDDKAQSTPTTPSSVQPLSSMETQRNTAAADNHAATTGQQASDEDRTTQDKLAWFTGVLAVVGVLQLAVMFLTWRVYSRQAGIMEQQIVTTRNIERAWIMADLSCASGCNVMNNTDQSGEITTSVMEVELRCSNSGRSPAWITRKLARLVISSEQGLPVKPNLGERDVIDSTLEPIAPGGECKFVWSPIGNGRQSIGNQIVIYGMVEYTDIFNNSRETWFCYQMDGFRNSRNLKRLAGNPEYNKNT
jgi:hypothetical protein